MNSRFNSLLVQGAVVCAAGIALRTAWRRVVGYRFENKVVVITGGSRGLGLVMARQLAAEGARLALCARNDEELANAEEELCELGGSVFTMICDLERPDQIVRFLTEVRHALGEIDVLINKAGVIQVGPLETMTKADLDEAMNIHFWAVYHAINAVIPEMRRRGGRIVNIASIGGKIAIPHLMPYCASKFALVGYSQSLRAELAPDGIVVTTVCPGLMRTGSPRNALFKGKHRAEYAWFSIGGSLPLLSINAERAARQILDACRDGRAQITLTVPARCAVVLDSIAPGVVAGVAALANRLLPEAGGIGRRRLPGSQSESRWSPSLLTTLNERASLRNNEILTPQSESR